MATTQKKFGIPYARAIIEGKRYGVECPLCKVKFWGAGSIEDTVTKSASRSYAKHYAEKHEEDES